MALHDRFFAWIKASLFDRTQPALSVEAAFLRVDALSDDELELDVSDFFASDVDVAAAPLDELDSELLPECLLEEVESPSEVIDDEEAPRLSVL
jgi:hypothetical protein